MPPVEEFLFLGANGRELFCARRVPAAPRAVAVFCHPFGEEKKNAYRPFVDLGRLLAEKGAASVSFDYAGCGDSSGEMDDATLEMWIEDTLAVIESARALAPAGAPVLLAGLRLGASIAALAALRAGVERLILWQPVVNGRADFAAELRRTLIKQMVTNGAAAASREHLLAELEQGQGRLDLDGFPFTGALYKGIASVDLLCLELTPRHAVSLIQIAHTPNLLPDAQRLAQTWSARGARVTTDAVVTPPLWARLDPVDVTSLLNLTVSRVEAMLEPQL